jgi:hypothetical protein
MLLIQEVPGSILDTKAGYPINISCGFTHSLQASAIIAYYQQNGYDRFLPIISNS